MIPLNLTENIVESYLMKFTSNSIWQSQISKVILLDVCIDVDLATDNVNYIEINLPYLNNPALSKSQIFSYNDLNHLILTSN